MLDLTSCCTGCHLMLCWTSLRWRLSLTVLEVIFHCEGSHPSDAVGSHFSFLLCPGYCLSLCWTSFPSVLDFCAWCLLLCWISHLIILDVIFYCAGLHLSRFWILSFLVLYVISHCAGLCWTFLSVPDLISHCAGSCLLLCQILCPTVVELMAHCPGCSFSQCWMSSPDSVASFCERHLHYTHGVRVNWVWVGVL